MKKQRLIIIEFLFHVLFWLFYVTYPFLLFGQTECYHFSFSKAALTLACIGIPSYMTYFLALKSIRNKWAWIAWAMLTSILVYLRCTWECACNTQHCIIDSIIELTFVNAIFLILFINKRNIRNIKLLAESEQARSEAEIRALKAQINPHFLFNTLNMLYSDAIHINSSIADKILKLSDNLHYLIHEGEKKEILISEEIKFIEDYLALQKSRLGDRVSIEFQVNLHDSLQKIPPLLIIPFIENAFKYSGTLEERKAPIAINISSLAGVIHVEVRNKFNSDYRSSLKKEWKESGIGIENVKRRLALLFPSKHKLLIREEQDVFFVKLEINTL